MLFNMLMWILYWKLKRWDQTGLVVYGESQNVGNDAVIRLVLPSNTIGLELGTQRCKMSLLVKI